MSIVTEADVDEWSSAVAVMVHVPGSSGSVAGLVEADLVLEPEVAV